MCERFYVVFESNSEYPRGVFTSKEYDESFDRLHPDYRPRCTGYDTKKEAEEAEEFYTNQARQEYSK